MCNDVRDQRARGSMASSSSADAMVDNMGLNIAREMHAKARAPQSCKPFSSGSSVDVAITLTGLPFMRL